MSQSRSSSNTGSGDKVVKTTGTAAAGYAVTHAAVHTVAGTVIGAGCTAACAPIALAGAVVASLVYLACDD